MHEMAIQMVGQQKKMAGYQAVTCAEDMVTVIRQAVTAHPVRFSQFALVTIEFHFAVMDGCARARSDEHSTLYLLNAMRAHTRKQDLVWLKDTTCYFLLAGASLEERDEVQCRLWKTLVGSIQIMQENTMVLPCAMTIGHSAYPEPSATIEECLSDALIPRTMPRGAERGEPLPLRGPEGDLAVMARQLGVPYVPFLPRTFPRKVKRLVRLELAQELHCFPLGCADRTLTVAMSNPQDGQVLDRLQKETGMRIFPVLIHPDELSNALEHIIR